MDRTEIDAMLAKRLEQGRTYRDMEIRALGDENEMRVEGYATTFNEFYELWSFDGYKVLEQVDARAFEGCDMSDVIMQYNHEGRVFARMSNNTLKCTPDEHGLLVRADLGGTELGRELYREIAGGYTTRMSFGFKVKEDQREVIEDHDTGMVTVKRTITKIEKLYDVSAVSLPANPYTEISARSYCDGVIAELKAERLRAEAEAECRRKKIAQIKLLTEV